MSEGLHEAALFAWASQDPRTREYVAYTVATSRRIESAWRAGNSKVDVLVEAGSGIRLVHVHFAPREAQHDLSSGSTITYGHTQRTASGVGERQVIRLQGEESELAMPDGTVVASSSLRSIMWVSLDPVTGEVVAYEKVVACDLERAYQAHQTTININITMPNGSALPAVVHLLSTARASGTQRTRTGERHVLRIPFERRNQSVDVRTRRLPEGTGIDSNRYRFATPGMPDDSAQVVSVQWGPEMVVDDEEMPEFAGLLDGDAALEQLGIPDEMLRLADESLKSEGYRVGCNALLDSYEEEGAGVPLTVHLEAIWRAWQQEGLVDDAGSPGPAVIDPPLPIEAERRGRHSQDIVRLAVTAACYKRAVLLGGGDD